MIGLGGFGGQVVRNTAGGLANAAARGLLEGTSFGDNILAALPDIIGQTIGGMVADRMAQGGSRRRMALGAYAAAGYGADSNAQLSEPVVSGGISRTILNGSALSRAISAASGGSIGGIAESLYSDATSWTRIVIPESGTYSYSVRGYAAVSDGRFGTSNAEHFSVVSVSGPPGAAFDFRDVVQGSAHYRQWRNEQGEFIGQHVPMEGTSAWTYGTPDHPDIVVPPMYVPTLTVSIQAIEPGAQGLGWRGLIYSDNPAAQHIARSWLELDLANPGSVDAAMYRQDREIVATQGRVEAALGEFDFQMGILAAPMLMLAGGPLEGGAAVGGAGLAARSASRRYLLSRAVAAESGGVNVWKLGAGPRGEAIEQALGHNLPGNFPVIDRFENGIATSIKSIDLDGASYLTGNGLRNTLTRYVDKVADFNGRVWAGRTIRSSEISGRALDVVVPHGGTAAQQATLNQIIKYGPTKGVTVNVIHYP